MGDINVYAIAGIREPVSLPYSFAGCRPFLHPEFSLILIPGVIGADEVWHLAVLAGLGLHWRFVFQFAHGAPQAPLSGQDRSMSAHCLLM
jgi:hypothetical protein